MGRDEQKEEREVLDSIYADEIKDISETEYEISIALDVINEDGDDSEQPSVILHVVYPDAYPDEAPVLSLTPPLDAPKHPYIDINNDATDLLNALTPTVEENIGMAMIFTLVSTLKDSAEQLIGERQDANRAAHEAVIAKAEAEENKKFHGTPVTAETFTSWREGFIKEMEEEERIKREEKEADDKKKRIKEEKKMTGRELWEKGLVGKVEEDDEDGVEVDLHKLRVSEATAE